MVEKPKRRCHQCGKLYIKNKHYSEARWSNSKFCSYTCNAKAKSERAERSRPVKKCACCGKWFRRNKKCSATQWASIQYCSRKCSGQAHRINDGMSKGERYRRRNGSLKQGTHEWKELIRARTSEAMMRPDIQRKIRAQRSPLSDEHRSKISKELTGRMPKNMNQVPTNSCYAHIQRGNYDCSKGSHYFRSKWEANNALFLDYLITKGEIVSWDYESRTFVFDKINFGTRSYTPDFEVTLPNGTIEYHEVKGHMDSRSKTKLKRMLKYYPEIKLVLIDRIFYMDLCKKVGKLLSFY